MVKIKDKIFIITFEVIIVIFTIIAIINLNFNLIIWPGIGMLLLMYIFTKVESAFLHKKIDPYIHKKEYDKVIEILNQKVGMMWIARNNNLVLIYLASIYMMNDQAVYTKKILTENPKLKNVKELFFIQLILGFAEGDKAKVFGLYKKIMALNIKGSDKVKNNTRMLMEMAKTKTFNKELYDGTSFPLLKKICLKYENSSVILDDLNIMSITYSTITNKKIKMVYNKTKLWLNILTCASFVVGFIIVIALYISKGRFVTIEKGYYLFKNCWLFLLFLPIAIINLCYSIYLKNSGFSGVKSLILSIFAIIGLIFGGSLTLISKKLYTTDDKLFIHYTASMDRLPGTVTDTIDRPDEYDIVTNSFSTVHESYLDEKLFLVIRSVIRITDEDYKEVSEKRYWRNDLAHKEFLPRKLVEETKGYDYYYIFNSLSNEQIFQDGKYTNTGFVVFVYDTDNDLMLMYRLILIDKEEIDLYR